MIPKGCARDTQVRGMHGALAVGMLHILCAQDKPPDAWEKGLHGLQMSERLFYER